MSQPTRSERRLARRIRATTPQPQANAIRRQGVITAVGTGRADARVGGVVIPGVVVRAGYAPALNDVVFVEFADGDPLIIGKRA